MLYGWWDMSVSGGLDEVGVGANGARAGESA